MFNFVFSTGVLQMIETAETQRKDVMDHPENYTLLTTLTEGSATLTPVLQL